MQFVIYYLLLNFYKSAFKCYQCMVSLPYFFLYILVSMLNSYDWLTFLCLIFVLICPYWYWVECIMYTQWYYCRWTNSFVLWKHLMDYEGHLMDYEGFLSTFCDYCSLSVHVLIYSLIHDIHCFTHSLS